MGRKRTNQFPGWMPGLYRKATRAGFVYYALPDGVYKGLGNDIHKARAELVQIQSGKPTPGTIGELLDDFNAYRWAKHRATGDLAPATLKRNALEITWLKKPFGKIPITEFRRTFAWQYLHQHRGLKNPASANREISLLSSAYEWAINVGRVEHNPVRGVEYRPENTRDRLVTHAELISFCEFAIANGHHAAASGKKDSDTGLRLALAAQLAYLTTKAQAQILRIPRRTFTDRRGIAHLCAITQDGIAFGGRKRGHTTIIEWTDALRNVTQQLMALPTAAPANYLVCAPSGSGYTSNGFRATWGRIMTAWAAAAPAGETRSRFRFHDLRAKGVTKAKSEGRLAADLTGHTSEAMADKVYDRRRVRSARAVE